MLYVHVSNYHHVEPQICIIIACQFKIMLQDKGPCLSSQLSRNWNRKMSSLKLTRVTQPVLGQPGLVRPCLNRETTHTIKKRKMKQPHPQLCPWKSLPLILIFAGQSEDNKWPYPLPVGGTSISKSSPSPPRAQRASLQEDKALRM